MYSNIIHGQNCVIMNFKGPRKKIGKHIESSLHRNSLYQLHKPLQLVIGNDI